MIPRYGLPLSIESDNGPVFVSGIIRTLSRTLGIKWKLHTAYRPQSSGKVERMNYTLGTTLPKLFQETSYLGSTCYPLSLTPSPMHPESSGYSPFEILYGRKPPGIGRLKGNPQQLADLEMSQYLWILGKVLHRIA